MAQNDRMLTPEYWRLDPNQSELFLADGHSMGIASPGAGKTRVLIAKAVRLAMLHGPRAVAIVTFSKPAVEEIQERLTAAIGDTLAKQVTVGTFHALAYKMLKDYWRIEKIRPPRLLGEFDAFDILKSCAHEVGYSGEISEIQGHLSIAKAMPISDGSLRLDHPDPQIAAILNLYEIKRRTMGAIDFSDMVREATFALRGGKAKPLAAAYILGDEYQDIDRAQNDWLDYHAKAGKTLTLVGDDDQSIYGFRASMGYAAMVQFVDKFQAERINMTTNYRSCQSVIAAARIVIEKNRDRFTKEFICNSTEKGSIRMPRCKDEDEQVGHIIEDFQDCLAQNPKVSYAVISRTNNGLDELEMVANGLNLPVHRMGNNTLLKKEPIVRRVAALACVAKPYDHPSMSSALMAFGISDPGKKRITDYFASCDKTRSILDVCFDASLYEPLTRDDATLVRSFRDILTAMGDTFAISRTEPFSESDTAAFINEFFDRIGSFVVETKVLGFLRKALTLWRSGSLLDRLASLEQQNKRAPTKVGALTLVTGHKSKGLEYDHVWIVDCSNGIFPSKGKGESTPAPTSKKSSSVIDEALSGINSDEERRLFYVAMTRAKSTLTMSYLAAQGSNMYLEELKTAHAQSCLPAVAATAVASVAALATSLVAS